MPANTKKNSFGLSKRESKFIEVYFATMSRKAAAEACTEFPETANLESVASQILKKPSAQSYLVYLQETHINKLVIDRNKLILESVEFYTELKSKGKTTDALKAFDILCKLTGSYTQNLNITQDVVITTNWSTPPTNQLLEGENNNLLDDEDEE